MSEENFDDLKLEEEETEPKVEIKSKTPVSSAPAAVVSKTPASGKSAGKSAGAKKNIFFKSTVGPERTEKLSIGMGTPVSEVKNTLANIFGLSPEDFHLSHAGRTIDDTAKIGEYNVENGDEILLIPQSTAGGEEEEGGEFEDFELEEEEEVKPVIKSKTPAAAKTVSKPVSKTPASGGASAGPKKNIFFKSTVGPERTEKLAIGSRTPIREVKETLANIFGLSPEDFHLSHAGRTMDEASPIGDYNVENGDEILLIPQSTAGAKAC